MENSYTDRKGITHKVVHRVVGSGQECSEREQKIVDELCALFEADGRSRINN